MYVYIGMYLYGLVCASSILFSSKGFKYSSIIFSFFILLIISFRYYTGTDYGTYIKIWNTIPVFFSGHDFHETYNNIEIGYKIFFSLVKYIDDGDRIYIFFNALLSIGITYLGLARFSKRIKINLFFSFFIYLCVFMIPYAFNAMRQSITMALFVYSISDFIDRKHFKVFLLSIFAYFFHSSGILIFCSYVVFLYITVNQWLFFVTIVSCLVLSVFNPFIEYLKIIDPRTFALFQDRWAEGDYKSILIRLLIVVYLNYILKYIVDDKKKIVVGLFTVYISGFFVYCLFFGVSSMMAARLNMFFRVIEIIIFPLFISYNVNSLSKVISFLFFILISTVYFISSILLPDNYYNFYF